MSIALTWETRVDEAGRSRRVLIVDPGEQAICADIEQIQDGVRLDIHAPRSVPATESMTVDRPNQDELLSGPMLARRMGISRATLWKWTVAGKLDGCVAIRSGRCSRFSVARLRSKGFLA